MLARTCGSPGCGSNLQKEHDCTRAIGSQNLSLRGECYIKLFQKAQTNFRDITQVETTIAYKAKNTQCHHKHQVSAIDGSFGVFFLVSQVFC